VSFYDDEVHISFYNLPKFFGRNRHITLIRAAMKIDVAVRLKVIYGFGAWCADYWRRECLGRGLVVEGVKGVKYAPKPSEMYNNGEKLAVVPTFWLINR
jgi:hypothetical protein